MAPLRKGASHIIILPWEEEQLFRVWEGVIKVGEELRELRRKGKGSAK